MDQKSGLNLDGVVKRIQEMDEADKRDALEKLRPLFDEDAPQRELFALHLCKASFRGTEYLSCLDPNPLKEDPLRFRSYAALGSVADSIQLHKLDHHGKLLEAVFAETARVSKLLDGTVFVNPQYVVYSYRGAFSDEKRYYDEFWPDPTAPDNFFFMTSVNMEEPAPSYAKRLEFRKTLCDKIHAQQQKQATGIFRFIVCDSLDLLSDFTILWRAENIRPVLETLRTICGDLGRKRTICSVPINRLFDFPQRLREPYKADGGPYDVKEDIGETEAAFKRLMESVKSDNLGVNMTLRAVSNDYQTLLALKEQLVNLTSKPLEGTDCFVLGNTDYIGFFPKMSDRNISTFLREVVLLIRQNKLNGTLLRMETNIGIEPVPAVPPQRDSQNAQKLRKTARWLLDDFKSTLIGREDGLFAAPYAPWVDSVLELCNMLVQMNNSCIYDNASFLLLDSIYLFRAWLEKEVVHKYNTVDEKKKRLVKESEHINQFVNGWIQLTDMITRSEGTIAHMPGYSPLQYHVISSAVEFTQAFFVKVSRFLRKCAKEGEDISCILVPTQCDRILNIEMLRGENQISDKMITKTLDRSLLVYIEVPMEILSRSQKIATILTHEAGHHYGQAEISCRMNRNSRFAQALGLILGTVVYAPKDEAGEINAAVTNWKTQAAIVQTEMNVAVDKWYVDIKENIDKERISKTGEPLPNEEFTALRTWDHLLLICDAFATGILSNHRNAPEVNKEAVDRLLAGGLYRYRHELKTIFSETVCDLLMLTMLHEKCGPKEMAKYIGSVFMDEADLTRSDGPPDARYSSTIMRIYTVWQVIQKPLVKILPGRESEKRHPYEYMIMDEVDEKTRDKAIWVEIKSRTERMPKNEAFLKQLDEYLEGSRSGNRFTYGLERIYTDAFGPQEIIDELAAEPVPDGRPRTQEFLEKLGEGLAYLEQRGKDGITKEKMNAYHPNAALEILIAYLGDCRCSILEQIHGRDRGEMAQDLEKELAEIRRSYQSFERPDFFSRPFYTLIHEYRGRMLEQIKDDGTLEEFAERKFS